MVRTIGDSMHCHWQERGTASCYVQQLVGNLTQMSCAACICTRCWNCKGGMLDPDSWIWALQSPMVGRWSDVYGRKPFLLLALICAWAPILVLMLHIRHGLSLYYLFPAQVRPWPSQIASDSHYLELQPCWSLQSCLTLLRRAQCCLVPTLVTVHSTSWHSCSYGNTWWLLVFVNIASGYCCV